MSALIHSFACDGIDAYPVDVESVLLGGREKIQIIGLADACVREAGERVRAAISCSGFRFPKKHLVISLAPSETKKRGSHFDLPMALSVLSETGEISCRIPSVSAFFGELALDGSLRPVRGVLSMTAAARDAGLEDVFIPAANAAEAALVPGIRIHPCPDLHTVIDILSGIVPTLALAEAQSKGDPPPGTIAFPAVSSGSSLVCGRGDFSEVVGQKSLIGAVLLACAGGHNMLMIGPPGCGKTMIAERIPGILPPLSDEEALEVTKIYSAKGILEAGGGLIRERPFRAPHHSASLSAMIGGGAEAGPGEVTLAHDGVLFLDELPEFSRRTLEALRQPLSDRRITVARVGAIHSYPASFLLVAAMNPCPCGYHPYERCRCSDYEISRYREKVSGPILDRIDIQKMVEPVALLRKRKRGLMTISSGELRDRVMAAREIQAYRFRGSGIRLNSEMSPAQTAQFCRLDGHLRTMLEEIVLTRGYSARMTEKFIRMARTSADLSGVPDIREEDIRYVLSCRDLDRDTRQLIAL